MAILTTFLCICNTRTGSLVSGCYTLAISLVCLVYFLFRYVGHKLVEDSPEYKGIIYVGFVLYGFMIISSLIIIPGVQLDKRYLLLPWIYIVILVVLYDTGSVALLTTVHMEREKTLHVWEIVWLFFYLFRLAANCYCFTCVVSQYQELSDGRGTYDYLYKPHRRNRLRGGGLFDIDTFDLPFGVHLPPYTEEDTTEHSPPLYSQIYPESGQNLEENSTEIDSTQHYTNNSDIPHCTCQICAPTLEINSASTQNVIVALGSRECADDCDCCSISPHCDYCMCSQDNVNSAYVDIEINPVSSCNEVSESSQSAGDSNTTSCQNNRSVLRYPIIVKNGVRTRSRNSSQNSILSRGLLYRQCGRHIAATSDTRNSSSDRNCYEVTVNLEWI